MASSSGRRRKKGSGRSRLWQAAAHLESVRLCEVFGIDLRSLAAFRVSLALCVAIDVLLRVSDLTAHYSDLGVLPRSVVIGEFSRRFHVSVFFAAGHPAVVALLFASLLWFSAGLAATALGLARRLFTLSHGQYVFGTWLLVVSLHARNTMVVHSGDKLMRVLLFWAMFVPGAHNRVRGDVTARGRAHRLTAGTAAVLVQAASVYFFTALHKSGSDWHDGTAVHQSLSLISHATPIAGILRNFRTANEWLTLSVWWFELLGGVIIFVPVPHPYFARVRTGIAAAYTFLNVGFGLCLRLGIFGIVCATAMIPFLPPLFWDTIVPAVSARVGRQWRAWAPHRARRTAGWIRARLPAITWEERHVGEPALSRSATADIAAPGAPVPAAGGDRGGGGDGNVGGSGDVGRGAVAGSGVHGGVRGGVRGGADNSATAASPCPSAPAAAATTGGGSASLSWGTWISSARRAVREGFVLAMLVYVTWWNAGTLSPALKMPIPLSRVGTTLWVNQKWDMFAPIVPRDSGWFVFPGLLEDGTEVDVFQELIAPRGVSDPSIGARLSDLHRDMIRPEAGVGTGTSGSAEDQAAAALLGGPTSDGPTLVTWARPAYPAYMYRSLRWRKYLRALLRERNAAHRPHLVKYLCRAWNSSPGYGLNDGMRRLRSVQLAFVEVRNAKPYRELPPRRNIWHAEECPPRPAATPKAKAGKKARKGRPRVDGRTGAGGHDAKHRRGNQGRSGTVKGSGLQDARPSGRKKRHPPAGDR